MAVTEYSDALVRRLIERITVYDEMLVVEFKSGLEIEVDAQEITIYGSRTSSGCLFLI